ncbi:endonuclease III [Prosthecochloris sp. HL-130-GSB]|jgi:endonuclease III|uniref:Endonuclease III n=1 Tax=Prosthecochloris aestuarii TaxID=1102 RepID=A0A831STX0_PROAE|nr:endonuclease III [Prosthecochloris sp. HL-130-GSB]ARM30344.1 endonuclease III [Prosthecochloris sp. HL-130-GSB]MBO8091971.1 endonuclease III [Prosthecochloris sp.]HED31984.1 endonuclease III [Prosthecochloris aestuarii]
MNRKEKIAFINEAMARRYPEPKSELNYQTPFQLLIATMLAAQSTDKKVNMITERLFRACPDAASMNRAELDDIKEMIRSINYYNNKAKNILATSRILCDKYNGEVPDSREKLEDLPGVGRKTANVVLSNAFHQPVMPVDTHVQRVSNRIGLVSSNTPLETEEQLVRILPEDLVINFHHYLVLHGRYTCKARKPLCSECPITEACDYTQKNL